MSTRSPLRTALAAALLVGLVFVVYGQVARHEFVDFDTQVVLTENPHVLRGLTWDGVRWAFTSSAAANWHPVTWLSHMLDIELFGLNAGAHHLENVSLHALSSVVLFLAWRRMTAAELQSWFVAAVFALHPLHVESVAWVVERKDVLSTLFGWCCLLAWAGYAARPQRASYLAALLFLALGLLSKPMLVTWPCVLLLFDVWPLRRQGVGWRRLVWEKLPFFALSAASAIATVAVQRAGGAVQGLADLPLSTRLANAPVAVVKYLANAFWPSKLAFYYPHERAGLSVPLIVFAIVCIAVVSVIVVALRRRTPYLAIGWCFFLGTLVPVIGIVQVGGQALADRYTYVPLLGVTVMVAWGVPDIVARWPVARGAVRTLAAIVLTALAFATWFQAATWRDTTTLCEHALAVTRDNAVAHDVLGIGLAKRGELDAAAVHLREAVRIDPGDIDALSNLATVLVRQNRAAEAEVHARRAVQLAPDRAELHGKLGGVLLAQRRFEEASVALEEALRLDRDLVSASSNLGAVLEALDRPLEAQSAYARALRSRPDFTAARLGLARLLARDGALDRASDEYAQALRYEPEQPDALRGWARVRHDQRQPREALALLERALRARPDWPLAAADVAWILAFETDPALHDVRRAIEQAERAATRTEERQPTVLDTLAFAYAADGQFERAVSVASKALERARESGERDLAARIAKRIDAYQLRRVDRETPR